MKQLLFLLYILTLSLRADNNFVFATELGIGEGTEFFIREDTNLKVDFISQPSMKITAAYKIENHYLRLSYLYNQFDNEDKYQAISLGYKYDFREITVVKNKYFSLIPTLSFDSGISFEQDRDLLGWINEIEAGFNFEFSTNFSFTCNYSASVIFWDIDNKYESVIDRVNERALKLGIIYIFGNVND